MSTTAHPTTKPAMTEGAKTALFIAAAAALLLAAWVMRPAQISPESQSDAGQEFFPEFTDPLSATSLEIVEYDADNGVLRPFKVAELNGVWSIPSHENYPTDAKNQLEQAAAAIIGLEKLSSVSDSPADHALYGVVEPETGKIDSGAEGVGKRVTFEDKSGNKVADFIIGKQDPDRPELHFVRVPGKDRVYRAVVKTDKLSTKFQNWIEQDLLKLNAFDVKEVVMDDHSVDELNQRIIQRGLTIVDFDNKESKWKLVKMDTLDPQSGEWKETTLAEDEELDSQKLNDLKSALDDLKIVDVARKPAGLSKELKGGAELVADRATRLMLQQRGFYFVPVQGGFDLYSNEGEVRCGLNDGVEYILRFGEIAGQSTDESDEDAAKKSESDDPDKPADEKEKKSKGVDRYIMVTAQFREDLIPKPELQPLPEGAEPEEEPATEAKPATDGDAKPETEGDAKPAAEGDATAPAAEPEKKDEAAPKYDSAGASVTGARVIATAYQPPQGKKSAPAGSAKSNAQAAPATKAAAPAATKEEPAKEEAAEESTEEPAADKAEQTPATEAAQPVDPDAAAEAEEKAKAAKATEVKQIRLDNKRKQDDYNKKVTEGQNKVKELNDRFADWYFIISDKTYEKIHIPRDQIIKKKSAEPAGGQPGAAGLPGGLPSGFQLPAGINPH